jgi:hypothetical protein
MIKLLIIDTVPQKVISYKEADRFGCKVWIMDIGVSGVHFLL